MRESYRQANTWEMWWCPIWFQNQNENKSSHAFISERNLAFTSINIIADNRKKHSHYDIKYSNFPSACQANTINIVRQPATKCGNAGATWWRRNCYQRCHHEMWRKREYIAAIKCERQECPPVLVIILYIFSIANIESIAYKCLFVLNIIGNIVKASMCFPLWNHIHWNSVRA